jgi:hypothetical protein
MKKYVAVSIGAMLLILIPSISVAAQGPTFHVACDGACTFFRLALSAIPTTGDPAADIAGLIALGSTLMTLARMVQASTLARGAGSGASEDDDTPDAEADAFDATIVSSAADQ